MILIEVVHSWIIKNKLNVIGPHLILKYKSLDMYIKDYCRSSNQCSGFPCISLQACWNGLHLGHVKV